jgi:hypothetical protein
MISPGLLFNVTGKGASFTTEAPLSFSGKGDEPATLSDDEETVRSPPASAATSKGRPMHLPVAPGCNIMRLLRTQVRLSQRKPVRRHQPGAQPRGRSGAVNLVLRHPQIGLTMKVVGIAGPGDPLANPQHLSGPSAGQGGTPAPDLCLSTNGCCCRRKSTRFWS